MRRERVVVLSGMEIDVLVMNKSLMSKTCAVLLIETEKSRNWSDVEFRVYRTESPVQGVNERGTITAGITKYRSTGARA